MYIPVIYRQGPFDLGVVDGHLECADDETIPLPYRPVSVSDILRKCRASRLLSSDITGG